METENVGVHAGCPRHPRLGAVGLCGNLVLGIPRARPRQEVGDAVEGSDLTKPLDVHFSFFHEQIIDLTEKFYILQKLKPTRIPETQPIRFYIEARTKNKVVFKCSLKPVVPSFKS